MVVWFYRKDPSLLSLSDKSTVDVVGNLDVDYATRSFTLRVPSRRVRRVDFGVMEWGVCGVCCYDCDSKGVIES